MLVHRLHRPKQPSLLQVLCVQASPSFTDSDMGHILSFARNFESAIEGINNMATKDDLKNLALAKDLNDIESLRNSDHKKPNREGSIVSTTDSFRLEDGVSVVGPEDLDSLAEINRAHSAAQDDLRKAEKEARDAREKECLLRERLNELLRRDNPNASIIL
ncbi:hypothetical protein BGZ46_001328 [Entomortierella lignicola]|nr:hypothetical protein BGZ46_001328 [Entomortierella lignicola]